jgi:SNF2 family DNA or RNA helicase
VEQRKHGSKLNAVAKTLREIRAADATAKAIVFVQWADLEEHVARALATHGIPTLRLSSQRRSKACHPGVIKQFQEKADSPFVLLLSLEHAASGSNLSAANHVLFVHPMNASSVQTAVAWERQAIGRVRRVGQVKSEVHVYRFVASHTVEEHMTRFHERGGA